MQKVFGQPTRVDDMGLPFDLCFSGEELPGEFDLSGLPFFSPSSGVEPPGASRRYPYGLTSKQIEPLVDIVADLKIHALSHSTINLRRRTKVL